MLVDIFNAIMSLVGTVVNFITHIPYYISQILVYIAHLPSFLIGAATMMIPVLIVNKLLHADNS